MKEKVFIVSGMHCPSCEVLIEKKLLKRKNIHAVEVSQRDLSVLIEYTGKAPTVSYLNELFKEDGYEFSVASEEDLIPESKTIAITNEMLTELFWTVGIVGIAVIVILLLSRSEIAALVSVNAASSIPVFFLFGLLAGASSCAALVGGLVLSMSKQWGEMYGESGTEAITPHVHFNIGRLVSFTILGGLLGALGGFLRISPTVYAVITIAVAILMLILGLQMLGVKALARFQITAPKFFTRYVADEANFQGKYMPLIMGALTFILPCGFTITAQGLALSSGSAIQGALIMLAFALGTLPMLIVIAVSSTRFLQRPHVSNRFLRIAGVLVVIFAFYNINSQLNVLGVASLNDLTTTASERESGLVPLENGKQIMRMNASSSGYSPNYFKVEAGIPVVWEITNKGVSGCTNAVISQGLFEGEVPIDDGVVYKEFTPEEPGLYKFSCWMGMVTGTIEVVDANGSAGDAEGVIVPANAAGDTGGCSGGCGGDCGGNCGNPDCPYAQ